MLTNEEKADRGRQLLDIYAQLFGDPYDSTANLTDVLTDLMHTSSVRQELRLNFQSSLQMAVLHFEAETEEQLEA